MFDVAANICEDSAQRLYVESLSVQPDWNLDDTKISKLFKVVEIWMVNAMGLIYMVNA